MPDRNKTCHILCHHVLKLHSASSTKSNVTSHVRPSLVSHSGACIVSKRMTPRGSTSAVTVRTGAVRVRRICHVVCDRRCGVAWAQAGRSRCEGGGGRGRGRRGGQIGDAGGQHARQELVRLHRQAARVDGLHKGRRRILHAHRAVWSSKSLECTWGDALNVQQQATQQALRHFVQSIADQCLYSPTAACCRLHW